MFLLQISAIFVIIKERGDFMGLFDIFKGRRQNAKNTTSEWTVYAQKMCATAVEYANEFNKN